MLRILSIFSDPDSRIRFFEKSDPDPDPGDPKRPDPDPTYRDVFDVKQNK